MSEVSAEVLPYIKGVNDHYIGKEIEKNTGKKVTTKENYLDQKQERKLSGKK